MATLKRLFIFATCLLSGIAALFSVISLSTEQWVVTEDARWISEALSLPNTIKYGLFQGFYRQQEPADRSVQIKMTCLLKENVCAMLCGTSDDDRYTLLKDMYNNVPNTAQSDACPAVDRANTYFYNYNLITYASDDDSDKKFINCGVWVSTILFLVLSIALGVTASALAILNTVSNPVEVYLSVFGLYIYNAAALACVIIAMVLWGIMHVVITYHDIGIFYTISGAMTSDGRAQLGYSYWINIIPICFYTASVVVLYLRQYLLSKDPGRKIVEREDNADPGIYLY